ncbi:MAG: hypothetical protein JXR95_13325 [Deltaproteobacteria bacterium]|nr:hypothetical protein [Deltaproteobacteria bacterium]
MKRDDYLKLEIHSKLAGLIELLNFDKMKTETEDTNVLNSFISILNRLKFLLDGLNPELLIDLGELVLTNDILTRIENEYKSSDPNSLIALNHQFSILCSRFPFFAGLLGDYTQVYKNAMNTLADIGNLKKNIDLIHNDIIKESNDAKKKIDKEIEDVKKLSKSARFVLVQTISDKVGEHFNKKAQKENSLAFWWRLTSIISIILVISGIILYWILLYKNNYLFPSFKLSIGQIIFPLPVTILLVFLGIYAGQISSKHRIYAKQLEWYYFEQMTLPGYIDGMGDEKQLEIKTQLSNKFFGNFSGIEQSTENTSEIKLVQELLLELIKKK